MQLAGHIKVLGGPDVAQACSQFHQRYTRAFFVQIFQQSQNVTRKTTFIRNICTYNVDEIDTWSTYFVRNEDVCK